MKYGIISDLHGNLTALQAALPRLDACDEVLCAGDVVGYGPDPNECCDLLQDRGWPSVLGNHDLASIDAYDLDWFNDHARNAIEWTGRQLTANNRAYLEGLSQRIDREDFSVVHGSLVSPVEQYVDTPRDAQATFEAMDRPLCFIGHTHVAMVFTRGPFSFLSDRRLFPQGGTIEVRSGRKYVANCGSLGQPRDRNPAGSFGIYDSETATVEIIRVPYEVTEVQTRMHAEGLSPWLIRRLSIGA